MPPELRSKQEETIISFLKSNEFKEIIISCVKSETKKLEVRIATLENEVKTLRESNIDLVRLLTSSDYQNNTILNKPSGTQKIINAGEINKSGTTENKVTENKQLIIEDKKSEARNPKKYMQGKQEYNDETKQNNIELNTQDDNDEGRWEFPRQRSRRRNNNIIYGKGNNDTTFKGVVRYIDYHVFRCPLDLSSGEIVKYLSSQNIPDVKCESMNSRYPEQYTSFKISVPANHVEKFKNPNIWPEYVGIDRFRHRFLRANPIPQQDSK